MNDSIVKLIDKFNRSVSYVKNSIASVEEKNILSIVRAPTIDNKLNMLYDSLYHVSELEYMLKDMEDIPELIKLKVKGFPTYIEAKQKIVKDLRLEIEQEFEKLK